MDVEWEGHEERGGAAGEEGGGGRGGGGGGRPSGILKPGFECALGSGRERGGGSDQANLTPACGRKNLAKAMDATPKE